MKNLLFALVLGFGILASPAQDPPASANSNVSTQAGGVRLNSPKANEQLGQNFVHVTYQLTSIGASPASTPNFTVQLDGNDPITTAATEYTFTGLTLGAHTVTVTLVDANGTPIANSSVSTKFTVTDGKRASETPTSDPTVPSVEEASTLSELNNLPDATTPLPMLSLVGFGLLVGGICTAFRNR